MAGQRLGRGPSDREGVVVEGGDEQSQCGGLIGALGMECRRDCLGGGCPNPPPVQAAPTQEPVEVLVEELLLLLVLANTTAAYTGDGM